MEDDDDSIERFGDDRRSSHSEFLRGLPRSSRQQKGIWNDAMDDKGDFYMKAIEKNIVHKNFFNCKF
ncbi:hypothetical protein BCR42DRAFT_412105 [Absidia repens]|uniref:Uncharacterized protein n=1 Tax=Absidia repens TaxID=90262 RepID=A0A1X2IMQ8_9FUNG|nr:hypothetical protein BCR42DRAFT_412105 [Absidia repens]